MVSNYCLICISTFLNQRKHRSILPAFVFTWRSLQTGIYYSTQLGYLRLDSRLSFIPLPFRLSNIQMIFYLSLTRQLLRFCKYCDLEFESWKGKGGSPLRKRCTVNDILKMSPLIWVIGETQWPVSALDTGHWIERCNFKTWPGQCFVFFGKTLKSYSASFHPGV